MEKIQKKKISIVLFLFGVLSIVITKITEHRVETWKIAQSTIKQDENKYFENVLISTDTIYKKSGNLINYTYKDSYKIIGIEPCGIAIKSETLFVIFTVLIGLSIFMFLFFDDNIFFRLINNFRKDRN